MSDKKIEIKEKKKVQPKVKLPSPSKVYTVEELRSGQIIIKPGDVIVDALAEA